MKSKLRCLRRRTQTGRSSHHRCAQHPIPHATHNPSVPAGSWFQSGTASFRSEAWFLLPLRRAAYILIQQGLPEKVARKNKNKLAQLSSADGVMSAVKIPARRPRSAWSSLASRGIHNLPIGNPSSKFARAQLVQIEAERIWGNRADANGWFSSPHQELGGATPLSMIKTAEGIKMVESLLAAIEFGFPV